MHVAREDTKPEEMMGPDAAPESAGGFPTTGCAPPPQEQANTNIKRDSFMLPSDHSFPLKMVDQMKSAQQHQNQERSKFADFKSATMLTKSLTQLVDKITALISILMHHQNTWR